MDSPRIPRQLLASIQAAPQPGIGLLFSLVDQGVVRLADPVDDAGTSLLDALVQGALHGTHAQWNKKEDLFVSLFAAEHADKWLSVSGGTAFAGRDQKGRWVVSAVLDKIEQQSQKSGKVKSATRKDDPFEAKKIDAWLGKVLPALPGEAWAEAGPELLAYALSRDFPRATEVAWSKVPVLAPGEDGKPVLLSARRGPAWDRFLRENGDPAALVGAGKTTLWRALLDQVCRRPSASADSFLGRFEQWFIDHAPHDERMRPHLKSLLFSRASSAHRTSPDQWVKLFEAAGAPSLFWEDPKNKVPFWQVVALSHPGGAAFDALEASPVVAKAIPREHLEQVRFLYLAHQLATASGLDAQRGAMEALEKRVASHGWPDTGVAHFPVFANLSLPRDVRARLRALADQAGEAWWGPVDGHDQLARAQALSVISTTMHAQELDTWMELSRGGEAVSPWLAVGLGVAGAIRNRPELLDAVRMEDARVLLDDPEGSQMLVNAAKRVQPRSRPHYEAWLQSMQLACASAPANAPRRGMRL